MLEVRQIKLKVNHTEKDLTIAINKALNLERYFKTVPTASYKIIKKSIDARKKPDLFFIYSVLVWFESDRANGNNQIENRILLKSKNSGKSIVKAERTKYSLPFAANTVALSKEDLSPVVIGSGPAGLFCAYILAKAGLKPIIFERGESVENRKKAVDEYWESGTLNLNSNVQFGEGGAGTFSDGKLNTLTKDKYGRQTFVLDTFVKFGARENITYDAKPHIGTDILLGVVKNMRNDIISMGGQFCFNNLVTGFGIEKNVISNITVNNDKTINASNVILAVGHSARDTFQVLKDSNVQMSQKSFAVGFRVQHPQELINSSQYGESYPENLEAAPYKLADEASNGRRVYSFCMCPGGFVVNASSEDGRICVNGMSYSGRDSGYANSAIVVGIDPEDFIYDDTIDRTDPLLGMYYQKEIERRAFSAGKGKIPVEQFNDFENKVEKPVKNNVNGVKGMTEFADLTQIFAKDINEGFIESMHSFGRKIKGFDNPETMLFGVEARTSSPVRIERDESFQSNIKGLYPCGEGAGYAGGIMSAAVDGIKVAEAVIANINKKGQKNE